MLPPLLVLTEVLDQPPVMVMPVLLELMDKQEEGVLVGEISQAYQ